MMTLSMSRLTTLSGSLSFTSGSYKMGGCTGSGAFSLYDPARQRSDTVLFGYDPRVACLADLGWAQWILGYPVGPLKNS